MPLLNILQYPDKRLRLVKEPVKTFDAALRQSVKDMFETMYQGHGVGLAATQVNLPYRLFVMDISSDQSQPLCLVNPEILEKEEDVLLEEGCLSFPGVYAKVKRAKKIRVRYQDEHGNVHEQEATGLFGHCIQHELDHLEGILFVDHLSRLKKALLLKKLEKIQRTQL